jgi:hypothetical protein
MVASGIILGIFALLEILDDIPNTY